MHTNKEAFAAWVEALRSGDYKQVTGALCKLDRETEEVIGHCCLGVACEIYAKDHNLDISDDPSLGARRYDGLTGYLPKKVITWLTDDHEENLNLNRETQLAEMNDGSESFAEIADFIETEYLKGGE